MKNKQRQFRMTVKSLGEDGTFEGILSPYNNVDDGADLVEPGAFTKTLQENGNTVPVLWQHKADCPIGDLTLEDRPDGLWCKGQLLLDIPEAKKAYLLLKAKIVKGLSIGYDAIKAQVIDGVRHLKEIRLWEGSVVTFPMNTLAMVTSVKARGETKGDFNEELNERQLMDAGYQMYSALQCALGQIPWSSDLSRIEMIIAADAVIQQFRDAFMEYIPQYLDVLTEMYGLDIKSWSAQHETKSGRRLSAATKSSLSEAHEHMKSAIDLMATLMDDEAGEIDGEDDPDDATSKATAVAATKSEPDALHSAAESLKSMRALLRA
jgi:HK97 family phage prohead protease